MASLKISIDALKAGNIIAYPTEAVWGLGCDPFCQSAVENICQLKRRPAEKGMILLVSDWEQAQSCIDPNVKINWQPIKESWPGPVTWVFPASNSVPNYLQRNSSIALRMPSYPFLQELLTSFGKPLVSTSANISGQESIRAESEVMVVFPTVTTYSGECQNDGKPSTIFDALTGSQLR